MHQSGLSLVAHDVRVIQHLILNTHTGLGDLVGRGVHELARGHDVLYIQVGLHRSADVTVVVAVGHTAGLAELRGVELLEERLQVSGVEVGRLAIFDHGLAAELAAVGTLGGGL